MAGARPECVSERAKERQRREMGTLGSGNHYLEVQAIAETFDATTAKAFGLAQDGVVVTIHCGSRGLGHQIGTDFLKEMVVMAKQAGIELPDRELACAPINSEVGQRYLGAMRAAINCAFANREILGHYTRRVFGHFFPGCDLQLLFDVSHNTCKDEPHAVDGKTANCSFTARGRRVLSGLVMRACPTCFVLSDNQCSSAAAWGQVRMFWWGSRQPRRRLFRRHATARAERCPAMQRSSNGADARSSTILRLKAS